MPPSFELTIEIKRLTPEARLPVRGSQLAAGADLFAAESLTLKPGERRAIATGVAIKIPMGWYGRIAPRSGLAAKHGVDTMAGVIDADYRGELKVLLINLGTKPVSFEAGDRIAQLIIERAALCDFVSVEELTETDRSQGGFGSTGR